MKLPACRHQCSHHCHHQHHTYQSNVKNLWFPLPCFLLDLPYYCCAHFVYISFKAAPIDPLTTQSHYIIQNKFKMRLLFMEPRQENTQETNRYWKENQRWQRRWRISLCQVRGHRRLSFCGFYSFDCNWVSVGTIVWFYILCFTFYLCVCRRFVDKKRVSGVCLGFEFTDDCLFAVYSSHVFYLWTCWIIV